MSALPSLATASAANRSLLFRECKKKTQIKVSPSHHGTHQEA